MKKLHLLGAVCACFSMLSQSGFVHAASISSTAFDASATVSTFENLGLPNPGPGGIVIDGNTYTTDGGNFGDIRYAAFDACLSNECVATNTTAGWMNIQIGTPILLAGGWLSNFSGNWSIKAEFFNTSNSLLGNITVNGSSDNSIFIGWQSESDLIGRVLFTDLTDNNKIMTLDNFTTQASPSAVPVPAAVWLFGSGLLGLIGIARRKKV